MNPDQGVVAEIFPSLQGEGLWVGQYQLFVRLAGCHYGCAYCDTGRAQSSTLKKAHVYFMPNGKKHWSLNNPFSAEALAYLVEKLTVKCGPFHSVVLTGGEPLEQTDFVEAFLGILKQRQPALPVMLETNGLQAKALERLLAFVDVISMDIKLRSTTGKPTPLKLHGAFLALAGRKPGWIKAVVSPKTTGREMVAVAKLIRQWSPDWEFILQPLSGSKSTARKWAYCYPLLKTAQRHHRHVRIVPQVHKLMGIA